MYTEDTICAIATAPGGALGIVRISGKDTFSCLEKVFKPFGKRSIHERKSHEVVFGTISDNGQIVDEVLVTLFRSPHSFTGEDSAEISCHGSAYILCRVVELLVASGCRIAHPGEYTQRAFLNGRMDLSQAEAVADVIASNSAANHRIAMNQMRGGISKELKNLREQLLHFTSLLELELDFGDHEELEFADRSELNDLCDRIIAHISKLVGSFRTGNALKNGVPVAIVGPTNAGKSTLLNALLHEERAIVSDIHGTTRDTIEDTVILGGILFRFIDTAGIRETSDTIEAMGIERSYSTIDRAEIVLLVTAPDCYLSEEQLRKIQEQCKGKKLIVVENKCDTFSAPKDDYLAISAKTGVGVNQLESKLVQSMMKNGNENDVLISNTRHFEALNKALAGMHRLKEVLKTGLSGDLATQDLREVLFHLAEITGGQITNCEVLGTIFSTFCIGK
ncbi:MAG: tRNA uridine-5-carboxymethylaminomethyl(34) synthesis GTPase MnmE [Bacteroidaceae bacterium]|nr:tRNA uridine-5-carboxymethylaminomethyl(34) synthesis GTPase MnmE [Bacteroidaceae bacterium]